MMTGTRVWTWKMPKAGRTMFMSATGIAANVMTDLIFERY